MLHRRRVRTPPRGRVEQPGESHLPAAHRTVRDVLRPSDPLVDERQYHDPRAHPGQLGELVEHIVAGDTGGPIVDVLMTERARPMPLTLAHGRV